ncbi:MAG: PTS sugar transporter subunit IIA [Planctomycetes bacterium]|nr:PTS sugar transporter subunit IIA [Planctomycetota bacterium]NOG56013.1 PTS sugar transporter subunit IIA [Planctomycetota bacterium]
MKLQDIVVESALIPALEAVGRDEVIAEMVDSLVSAKAVDSSLRDELVDAVLARERRGSTGFGKGVAVPHVKHAGITKMVATIGVSPKGVDFHALDRQPVHSVVLLLSPDNQPEEHLRAMEIIFGNLSQDTFRRFLRQATTVDDIVTLIREADSQQLVH